MDLLSVFKRGSAGPASVDSAPSLDSVATARKRARQRLVGATILVIIAVIGFPLVFDSAPRPVSVDVPIVIPRKDGAPALAMPSAEVPADSGVASGAAPAPASGATVVAGLGSAASAPASMITEGKDEAGTEIKPPVPDTRAAVGLPGPPHVAKPVKPVKPVEKPVAKAAEKPAERPAIAKVEPAPSRPADDAGKARALLENKPVAKADPAPAPPKPAPATAATPSGDTRFAIQVAAFSTEPPVQEMRNKLDKAGVKSYTQVIDSALGKRFRVRVGPFASREEAERAAGKIKSAGLPSSIVPL